jgi:hypothetical protein
MFSAKCWIFRFDVFFPQLTQTFKNLIELHMNGPCWSYKPVLSLWKWLGTSNNP